MGCVGDSLLGSSFYDEGTLSLPSKELSLGIKGRMAYSAVVSRLTGRTAPTAVGRYRLVRLIGQGAFGSVYEAHDPHLDRRVAIKIVDSIQCERDPHARARLVREAQALARLRHPNVVQIFDVGTFDGTEGKSVYIVMELLEGPTLRDWVRDDKPSPARIIEAYSAAARGLSAAHALGIVHRDFKPSNVMFDVDGTVKVFDFGLARVASHANVMEESTEKMPVLDADDPLSSEDTQPAWETHVGVVVGTPRYMAPEQQRGETATPLADQYAWCVALWTALVGDAPYDGTFVELVIEKRLGVPKRPARLSRRLYRVLARGLEAEPGARFGQLEDLLDALRQPKRRHLLTLVGLVGLGLAAAVSGATQRGGQLTSTTACVAEASRMPTRQPPTTVRSSAALNPAHIPTSEMSSYTPVGN